MESTDKIDESPRKTYPIFWRATLRRCRGAFGWQRSGPAGIALHLFPDWHRLHWIGFMKMKPGIISFAVVLSLANAAMGDSQPIDRQAVVTRHNIEWDDLHGEIPLGNGEFCFNADATGLQTFSGSTMSHWGWHSNPLPEGFTAADIPATGTVERGRITGPMVKAAEHEGLRDWMFQNPHPMNLGRLRFVRANGEALEAGDISGLTRTYHLWTGLHTSRFTVEDQAVEVETSVHPYTDLVSVRVTSPLLREGKLAVMLDFPYPTNREGPHWVGAWNRPEAHHTQPTISETENRAEIRREADDAVYYAAVAWSDGGQFRPHGESGHSFMLSAEDRDSLEFVSGFSGQEPGVLPGVAKSQSETAAHWEKFWQSGGVIDLSSSRDPRWRELERRVVLSQYHMGAQSAGSWPSPEIGLMGIDFWNGQFHMEMTWWHLAHYGLWDRWHLGEEALEAYPRFLPMARKLAEQFDYQGAKWGKQVGPEGRTAPWRGSFVLHWQQPHPMFFAELEYRLRPTRRTLEKWDEIIEETADYMADFPTRDETTGLYSLKPIMPPSEQGITRDSVFDLAYWRWGLEQAQVWRERLGRERNPVWEQVRTHLMPLPIVDGVYVHSHEWADTYVRRNWEHPDPIGPAGMLPPVDGLDPDAAHRTVLKVWETWQWDQCWGWDFPWMAMAAARVGEPSIAVDALLKDADRRNHYDRRGINHGGPSPYYLPGNGGLLYAVAMMAAGWDGAEERNAPGFPDDGTWEVRWEGLKPAP